MVNVRLIVEKIIVMMYIMIKVFRVCAFEKHKAL